MRRSALAVCAVAVVAIGAFFAYRYAVHRSPCETIFQQTSVRLSSKVELLKRLGSEVSLEEQKIQDLTERAQVTALNLKTCCIMTDRKILAADGFLKCKSSADAFGDHVERAVATVDQARAAKQQGDPDLARSTVARAAQDIAAARGASDALSAQLGAAARPLDAAPSPRPSARAGAAERADTNLLAPSQGARIVASTSAEWQRTNSGDEQTLACFQEEWAVFAFKDDAAATLRSVRIPVFRASTSQLKRFEVLAGSAGPTGPFETLGTFDVQNVRFEDPYQTFPLTPTRAKYVKFRLISNQSDQNAPICLNGIEVMGSLQP